jgi:hypothetical protein
VQPCKYDVACLPIGTLCTSLRRTCLPCLPDIEKPISLSLCLASPLSHLHLHSNHHHHHHNYNHSLTHSLSNLTPTPTYPPLLPSPPRPPLNSPTSPTPSTPLTPHSPPASPPLRCRCRCRCPSLPPKQTAVPFSPTTNHQLPPPRLLPLSFDTTTTRLTLLLDSSTTLPSSRPTRPTATSPSPSRILRARRQRMHA